MAAKARTAADRALALDDRLAEAHTARGLVAHVADWDPTRAQREFLRAIELKPGFAYGIHWYAHYLDSHGQMQEAERQMSRAIELDPLSRMYQIDAAMLHWKQRRFTQSLVALDRARTLDPEYAILDLGYGSAYLSQKRYPEALGAMRRLRERLPIAISYAAPGEAEALAGDAPAARKELDALVDRARTSYVPAYTLALLYYALGERGQGLAWLRRAYEDYSGMLFYLKNTPLVDVMRRDPEGAALLERFGEPAK